MKSLKKILSLVLVFALVLSFGAIGAGAAFTDVAADEEYTEAIDVMAGIGVINGMTATTFEPDAGLTREQAAKIVTYMLLGPTNAQLVSAAATPRYTDVAVTRWSAGYIEYCTNQGIIVGRGDGTFDPAGVLTSAAFTKMLLVAAGFNAEAEGYVGASWALNVAVDAVATGIYEADIAISASRVITRAEACQLAYLGLFYAPQGTVTKYTVLNGTTVISTWDSFFEAYLAAGLGAYTVGTTTLAPSSLAAKIFGLSKTTNADCFGRPGTFYNQTGKTSPIAMNMADAAATYTTGITYGTVYTVLGLTAASTATLIEDGVAAGAPIDIVKGDTTAIGGAGTLTEVYKNGDVITIVVINTYVKKLTAGDIKPAVAATSTTDATPAYIILEGAPAAYDADGAFVTSSFKADDVVIYTVADGVIKTAVLADNYTGKVTATGTGYFRIDGTMVVWSANAPTPTVTIGTDYTFYTDSYGNIILTGAYAEVTIDTSFTYVITSQSIAGTTGDLIGDGTAAAAKAKVLDLTTGEVSVVDIAIVLKDGVYYYAAPNGSASATQVATGTPRAAGYYAYNELANGYVFATSATATEDVTTAKDQAGINVSGKFATSSTVLKVIEYTTNFATTSVTTYTGIANFPTLTAAPALVVASTTGAVSSITVIKAAQTTAAASYAVYKGLGEIDLVGQRYAFYVNGEVVEYYLDSLVTAPTVAGTVYGLTIVDGEITVASEKTALKSGVTVTAIDSTFIVLSDATVVYFASGYVVVDADASYALDTLAVGDAVTVYGATNAEFIVINN